MMLATALKYFLRYKNGKGRAAGTQRNYYTHINNFIRWAGYTHHRDTTDVMTAENITTYLLTKRGHWSEHTRRLASALLIQFAEWGAEEEQRYWPAKAVRGLEIVRAPKMKPRPYLAPDRDKMWALKLDVPDACCRGLLYYTLLRNGEARGIRLRDITAPHRLPNGEQILGRLYVFGKGSQERVVDIHPALWELIAAQLATLPADTPMARTLLAKPDGTPWTEQMVQRRAKKWGKAAGVEGRTHPHRWRHTGAGDMLENSKDRDLSALQKFMGHGSIVTTMGYADIAEERRAALVRSLPTLGISRPDMPAPPTEHVAGREIPAENAGPS